MWCRLCVTDHYPAVDAWLSTRFLIGLTLSSNCLIASSPWILCLPLDLFPSAAFAPLIGSAPSVSQHHVRKEGYPEVRYPISPPQHYRLIPFKFLMVLPFPWLMHPFQRLSISVSCFFFLRGFILMAFSSICCYFHGVLWITVFVICKYSLRPCIQVQTIIPPEHNSFAIITKSSIIY